MKMAGERVWLVFALGAVLLLSGSTSAEGPPYPRSNEPPVLSLLSPVGPGPRTALGSPPAEQPGLLPSRRGAHDAGTIALLTSVITPTNDWADFWSQDSSFLGDPLPVGSVVDAYDPDEVRCGTFTVTLPGRWGLMHVYGDYPMSPDDEGASPGDTITFVVNGYTATVASGTATWESRALREIELETTPPFFVWQREAEDAPALAVRPLLVGEDSGASACQYVYCEEAGTACAAIHTFEVPADGDYYLWTRAMGLGWGQNAFLVSVDYGPDTTDIIPWLDGEWTWRWQRVDGGLLTLAGGKHTVRFKVGEPDVRLDRILLTNGAEYVPAGVAPCPAGPGAHVGDGPAAAWGDPAGRPYKTASR